MPILRVKKRDHPFVQVDKRAIQDQQLSWKAKGLLCYLLSKPDDWTVRISHLKKQSTDGRDSTRTALNELIDSGYIEKNRQHEEDGKFAGFEYIVLESPNIPSQSIYGKSVNGLSVNGKPDDGKSDTTNIESTNKDLNNSGEEGSPARADSESLPKRLEEAETPEALLELWTEYREEIDMPLGQSAKQLALKQIQEWGVWIAKENIQTALMNGYKGLKPYHS